MIGELVQSGLNEFRDEHDASDPLNTLGRFVGMGINLMAMNEVLEVAGNMNGGIDMGVAANAPTFDQTLQADATNAMTQPGMPMAPPSPGGMGGMR